MPKQSFSMQPWEMSISRFRAALFLLLISLVLPAGSPPASTSGISDEPEIFVHRLPFPVIAGGQIMSVYLLDRIRVNETYSAIAVRVTSLQNRSPEYEELDKLFRCGFIAILIIDNKTTALYMTVDVFPARSFPKDYYVTFRDARNGSLIISRDYKMYGRHDDMVRYFINLDEKKVLKKIAYHEVAVYSMAEFEGDTFFLGTDALSKTIIAQVRTPLNPGALDDAKIIDSLEGSKISPIAVTRQEKDRLVLLSEKKAFAFSKGMWKKSDNPEPELFRPDFGKKLGPFFTHSSAPLYEVNSNFVLTGNASGPRRRLYVSSGAYPRGPGYLIFDVTANRTFTYQQPDYGTFKKYRPRRVSNGYKAHNTHIGQGIGPFQLNGNKIWFGTVFYDGEGHTGVGGIGFFDLAENRLKVSYYKEIADWSASALYVEQDSIWLGLAGHPEGSSYPGGLIRYDRRSGSFRNYDVPGIIYFIKKRADALWMGTTDGISILRKGRIESVIFTFDKDGRRILLPLNQQGRRIQK